MKKSILVLAIVFFASPAFAQDYSNYSAYGLQPYQLLQLNDNPQLDQSFRFYQPLDIQQQQSQNSRSSTVKHSHKRVKTDLPSQPVDAK